MDVGTDLEPLLASVYDAALDPERWPDALGGLDLLLRGSTCLSTHDSATQRRDGFTSGELMAGFLASYNEHYARINPLWPATVASPAGTVLIDREVVGRDAFDRGEFRNDFSRRIGLHAGMAVKVLHEGSVAAVLVVARGRGQGEFDQADAKLLARLAPHLQRAVQVNRRLSLSRGETEATAGVLDRLPHGAMLVDAAARVLFANRLAQSILAAKDGLRSDPDGLRADTPAQTNDLRRQIGRAAVPAGSVEAPPGSLALTRASGRRPLSTLVTPAAARGAARSTPAALVFVADPELALAVPPEHLHQLYGLTRAEAATAVAVLQGDGLRAVADSLGVTLATVRTHLRRVFEKTDTRRQAELVSLLLAGGVVATEG